MKIETIKSLVEAKLDIDLSSKSRKRPYIYGRAIYYQLCNILTKSSLGSIGRSVGVGHATVINGIKTYENVISQGYEPFHNKIYHRCRRTLRGEIVVENKILSEKLSEVRESLFLLEDKLNRIEDTFKVE